MMMGRYGNTLLVNGKAVPSAGASIAAGAIERWRLVNSCGRAPDGSVGRGRLVPRRRNGMAGCCPRHARSRASPLRSASGAISMTSNPSGEMVMTNAPVRFNIVNDDRMHLHPFHFPVGSSRSARATGSPRTSLG